MAQHFTLSLKTLRRINNQDVKSAGDGKMTLVNQELVLGHLMYTVTLKLMKHSIKRNKNKEMQKTIVGMGKGDGKV